jgi:hypothetical protein
MVRPTAQLALVAALAAFTSAVPASGEEGLVKFPVHKRARENVSITDVLAKDLGRISAYSERAATLRGGAHIKARVATSKAINEVDSYIAEVTVGNSVYDLIIDTGSSNTWVCSTLIVYTTTN